ncbi:MAG: hypothetical protein JNM86_14195 [Phycisphaerae bacterium]|nr:hypothetical protein [Phycisphaerae bacterium]
MLFLNPTKLSLLSADYSNIESVSIDRLAHREVTEYSDAGPYAVFADIPESKVEIAITQRLDTGAMTINDQSLTGPKPGQQGTLELITSPNSSQAQRKKLTTQVVIRAVRYDLAAKPKRTISLVAISPDGATDPITLIDL